MYNIHQQVFVQIFELQVPMKKKLQLWKIVSPNYNSKLHETTTCLFEKQVNYILGIINMQIWAMCLGKTRLHSKLCL